MILYKRNINKPAQTLLFVFFILILSGILTMGLHNMWQSEVQSAIKEREGIKAFYIAQAGVEYTKMRLATQETWLGGVVSFGGGSVDISVRVIACPVGPYNACREITSTGTIASADRRINLKVSLGGPPVDIPGDESLIEWSWKEF